MRKYLTTLELKRLEAILWHINKPNLYKNKKFDNTLTLFTWKIFYSTFIDNSCI